ncbi:MAG: DUF2892 domain-containing protein [Actinomycetota bacterium]|nr:DUF2892 domain-containing protein [Actinomycetota bacterium]
MNITPVERLGRVAIGLAAAIAGRVLLGSASSALSVVLFVLRRHDRHRRAWALPADAKLGHMPTSLRRPA